MLEEMACERYMGAPVDWERRQYNQTVESMDYIELLKNGFSLQWTGINCVDCQLSGGSCGFDENNGAICFCPDRPHTAHCNDGEAKNNRLLFLTFIFCLVLLLIFCKLCTPFYEMRRTRRFLHSFQIGLFLVFMSYGLF
ncbi:hypothetical protein PVL29_000350 [Vitis rotundifolia]|uniref:Wall-associated receptor kinase C-terminal domain-containing protein n=1 Tax=Vitis rotundifolia TaxID=103349 RepID=A0AA39AIH2_VITRO|nr:hypothetical protein PVL29_000350 [Vitis rotundifolia]